MSDEEEKKEEDNVPECTDDSSSSSWKIGQVKAEAKSRSGKNIA